MPDSPPRAKRKLGQHFLANRNICQRIAGLLDAQPEDFIIEIGPGPGALTNFLQNLPHATLLLIERDPYWARECAKNAAPSVQTILADALDFDWTCLNAVTNLKIIGNLPYNIASPLVWNIAAQCETLKKAVFMVQKEVALRMVAKPHCKAYGALSIWVQSFWRPLRQFDVHPSSFNPPPKVMSTVLTFDPLPQRPEHPEELRKLLNICFQARRKQIGSIFRKAGLTTLYAALEKFQISPSSRPEDLAVEEWWNLARFLAN